MNQQPPHPLQPLPAYVPPEVQAVQLLDALDALTQAVPAVLTSEVMAKLREIMNRGLDHNQQQPPQQQ
jgi:hypothetical protein